MILTTDSELLSQITENNEDVHNIFGKDTFSNGERMLMHGAAKVSINNMIEAARETEKHIEKHSVHFEGQNNFGLTPDASFWFNDEKGVKREQNITDRAFQQVSTKIGVPAGYIQKCFEAEFTDLAIENFERWVTKRAARDIMVKSYMNNVRGIVSKDYEEFPISSTLEIVRNLVADTDYIPNQAFISPDKMNIRFVDFNPLQIPGHSDKNYAGFTVSNDVMGNGSLNIKFFLYRFACKNGMVVISKGGYIYRQTHLQLNPAAAELEIRTAFSNIQKLKDNAGMVIAESMNKRLTDDEMHDLMYKISKNAMVGQKTADKILNFALDNYDSSKWGILNGVTEYAQKYTLDNRIMLEQAAGNLLYA